MDRDVFISHATGDAACAAAICRSLEAGGLKCWMAPRDILPGTDYSAAVVSAIPRCRALVLLLSRHANDSQWVHREVERAVARGKPVLTVRLEAVAPAETLELFISSSQWFDVFGMKPATYLSELATQVQRLLRPDAAAGEVRPISRPAPSGAAPALPAAPTPAPAAGAGPARPRRLGIWLAAGGSVMVLIAVVAVIVALLAGGVEPESAIASFESLQAHFKNSIREQRRCSWDDDTDVRELKRLAAEAPPAEALAMDRKLDELKSTCDTIEHGGDPAQDALSELDRQHRVEALESGSTGMHSRAAAGGH